MGQHAYIALLRGINVGGKNKVTMADLASLFESVGCARVITYIQSGNVVFTAPDRLAAKVPARVEAAILERFGFRSPVVARTADELRAMVRTNPFLAAGADSSHLHVAFLANVPSPDRVSALDPRRSPPDELLVVGRDVYLHLPNGVGRSRITNAYLDTTLRTVSTLRNWRTVLALIDRAGP